MLACLVAILKFVSIVLPIFLLGFVLVGWHIILPLQLRVIACVFSISITASNFPTSKFPTFYFPTFYFPTFYPTWKFILCFVGRGGSTWDKSIAKRVGSHSMAILFVCSIIMFCYNSILILFGYFILSRRDIIIIVLRSIFLVFVRCFITFVFARCFITFVLGGWSMVFVFVTGCIPFVLVAGSIVLVVRILIVLR